MPDNRKSNSTSLIAVGCCLIVIASDGSIGPWKYLIHAAAIALFVTALILDLRPFSRRSEPERDEVR